MSIDEFIVFFKTLFVFSKEFVEEWTPETEFRYLDDWSSLMALEFIVKCQSELGKTVIPSEMKKTETLQELYDLVFAN